MSSGHSAQNDDDRRVEIEETAAGWIARHYRGLTPLEEDEFQRWLASDAIHRAAYMELEETWRLLDRIRISPEPQLPIKPDPDALAPRRQRSLVRWRAHLLGAAAALAIGYAGWSNLAPRETSLSEQVATDVGASRQLKLPDGSAVHLNTDSAITVRFTGRERRVGLVRGEAHFTVAKDVSRSFRVDVGNVRVQAVGTAFNVRLRAETVEVLVTEGRVRVDDSIRDETLIRQSTPGSPPHLSAGERVLVPAVSSAPSNMPAVEAVPVPGDEMRRALAWQDRRLEFVATPLHEIVAEFNRYHRRKLAVGDAALGAHRFGGSFRVDEPETFVRLMETRFGFVVERRTNETVLRSAP